MDKSPKRSVEANELQSTELPRLRIQIEPSLDYIGNLNSTVLDNAHIDNYYFIDKNADGQIQRILYFQFEGYLPDNNLSFDYPDMQSIAINGHEFGYDGGVRMFKHLKIDEQPENSDVRQTVEFLKENDVRFSEGDFYGMLRFAFMWDEAKRNDMLVIYLERLEEADIPEDIVAKSRHSGEWSVYCKQLLARALRTFTICE